MKEYVVEPSTGFISNEVAQMIWDSALEILNSKIENRSDEELAYYNGIFYYAVQPALCEVDIGTEVLDMMRYPFCYVTGWGECDRRPLSYEASVWEAVKKIRLGDPDPFSRDGAQKILFSKYSILGLPEFEVSNRLCDRYISIAQVLDTGVEKLFASWPQYFVSAIARVPDQKKRGGGLFR